MEKELMTIIIEEERIGKASKKTPLRDYIECSIIDNVSYDDGELSYISGKLNSLIENHTKLIELLVKKGMITGEEFFEMYPKYDRNAEYKLIINHE